MTRARSQGGQGAIPFLKNHLIFAFTISFCVYTATEELSVLVNLKTVLTVRRSLYIARMPTYQFKIYILQMNILHSDRS